MKMSFIKQQDNPNEGNDFEFDQKLFEDIQKNKIDIENLDEGIAKKLGEEEPQSEEISEEDEIDYSNMDEEEYIEQMNDDIEENMRLYNEKKNITGKKIKEKKQKPIGGQIKFERNVDEEIEMEGDNDEDIQMEEDHEQEGVEKNNDSDNFEDERIENPLRKEKNMMKGAENKIIQAETKPEEKNEEEMKNLFSSCKPSDNVPCLSEIALYTKYIREIHHEREGCH